MCFGCYQDAGAPRELSDQARYLARLLPEASDAGPLHIVVADWNLEDHNIKFCFDEAEKALNATNPYERSQAQIGRTICVIMSALPIEQRHAAMALADGYLTIDGEYTAETAAALAEVPQVMTTQ